MSRAICPAPGANGGPCGRPVRTRGTCKEHYQLRVRMEEELGREVEIHELRALRGRHGKMADEALVMVGVRLHPLVIAELDLVQGQARRAATIRLLLGAWAAKQVGDREGDDARKAAVARMAVGYGAAPAPKRASKGVARR